MSSRQARGRGSLMPRHPCSPSQRELASVCSYGATAVSYQQPLPMSVVRIAAVYDCRGRLECVGGEGSCRVRLVFGKTSEP
uniref:Uncharacterized protein n=1 Tax=Zea mays TaxID=4577 RepID=A0A804MI13_MAIZE